MKPRWTVYGSRYCRGVSAVDTNGAQATYSSAKGYNCGGGRSVNCSWYPSGALVQSNGTSKLPHRPAGFLAMARGPMRHRTSCCNSLVHTTVNPDGGHRVTPATRRHASRDNDGTDPVSTPVSNPSRTGAAPARREIAQRRRRRPAGGNRRSITRTPIAAWTNPSSAQPRTRTRHTSVRAATTRGSSSAWHRNSEAGALCGVPASSIVRWRLGPTVRSVEATAHVPLQCGRGRPRAHGPTSRRGGCAKVVDVSVPARRVGVGLLPWLVVLPVMAVTTVVWAAVARAMQNSLLCSSRASSVWLLARSGTSLHARG